MYHNTIINDYEFIVHMCITCIYVIDMSFLCLLPFESTFVMPFTISYAIRHGII